MPVPKKATKKAPIKTEKVQFKFANGSRLGNNEKATEVGNYLRKIADGKDIQSLTPEEVVQAAKDKSSPLHDIIFKLSEREAAYQYRLERARLLLRSLVVYYVDNKGQTTTSQAFLSVSEGPRVVYYESDYVWKTPSLRDSVVEEARRDLEAFLRRYQQYDFMAKAVTKLKMVLKTIK